MFKVKGQRSRSYRNVSAVKTLLTATDRLTDLKLGTGVLVKAENDWRGLRRPHVAVHS